MGLSGPQKSTFADMVGESLATITPLVANLDSDLEDDIEADIVLWDTVKDDHLKLSGGKDGVDIDAERDRMALRKRNRIRVGLSAYSENDLSTSDVYTVNMRGAGWF